MPSRTVFEADSATLARVDMQVRMDYWLLKSLVTWITASTKVSVSSLRRPLLMNLTSTGSVEMAVSCF